MASLMTLEVLTPDQYLMKRKDIAYVLLNTVTGGIGILANHGPLIAVLGEGTLKLQDGNNHVILLYVEGGFAEVKDNKVIILTPNGTPSNVHGSCYVIMRRLIFLLTFRLYHTIRRLPTV